MQTRIELEIRAQCLLSKHKVQIPALGTERGEGGEEEGEREGKRESRNDCARYLADLMSPLIPAIFISPMFYAWLSREI